MPVPIMCVHHKLFLIRARLIFAHVSMSRDENAFSIREVCFSLVRSQDETIVYTRCATSHFFFFFCVSLYTIPMRPTLFDDTSPTKTWDGWLFFFPPLSLFNRHRRMNARTYDFRTVQNARRRNRWAAWANSRVLKPQTLRQTSTESIIIAGRLSKYKGRRHTFPTIRYGRCHDNTI